MPPQLDFTKRYYVFECERYYPAGGLDDVTLTTNLLDEARERVAKSEAVYKEIFDRVQGVRHEVGE